MKCWIAQELVYFISYKLNLTKKKTDFIKTNDEREKSEAGSVCLAELFFAALDYKAVQFNKKLRILSNLLFILMRFPFPIFHDTQTSSYY